MVHCDAANSPNTGGAWRRAQSRNTNPDQLCQCSGCIAGVTLSEF